MFNKLQGGSQTDRNDHRVLQCCSRLFAVWYPVFKGNTRRSGNHALPAGESQEQPERSVALYHGGEPMVFRSGKPQLDARVRLEIAPLGPAAGGPVGSFLWKLHYAKAR